MFENRSPFPRHPILLFIYLFFWNEDTDVCRENTQGRQGPMRITLVSCISNKDIHI